jgi:hypothetical protein
MRLLELFKQVKDDKLSREQVEDFHKELSELRADIKLELAGIQKEKAMFMLGHAETPASHREINWKGSEKGQREIDLKAYLSATTDHINSLKTRIYALL